MIKRINLLFIGILIFSILYNAQGQYVVTKVTDQAVNTTQDGFFYSLPATVLKVTVVYQRIDKLKGPLADFTLDYLGTSDYIASNSTTYSIIHVDVDHEYIADPNQKYYVQFPTVREKDAQPVTFNLSASGTLLSFDESSPSELTHQQPVDQTFIILEGDKGFDLEADYNRKKRQDTITRKITIDTVSIERFIFKTTWVDKSDEDKANEAAMQIAKLREGRFNLLTGYQEVNYGESMKYMDEQLLKIEKQYLELFLGKELKSVESQTIYYTPSKGKPSDVLLDLGNANQVLINIRQQNSNSVLPEKPIDKVDNIYYRIPEQATVEVEFKGKVYFRKIFTINQLGNVSTAPLNRTKTQFDPQTGSLRKIIRE